MSRPKSYVLQAWPRDAENYNLIYDSDDPTTAQWTDNGIVAALADSGGANGYDPEGGTDHWKLTGDGIAAAEHLAQEDIDRRQLLRGIAAGRVAARVAFRADGSDDEADVALYESTGVSYYTPASYRILRGPGTLTESSGVVRVTGLSATFWTEVEILYDEIMVAGADFRIFPGNFAAAAADAVWVFRPQVQHESTLIEGGPAASVAVGSAIAEDIGTGLTNETVAANSATASDMTLLPASPADGDAYYFAGPRPFHGIDLNIATGASSDGHTIVWEYYDPDAVGDWVEFDNVSDGTNGFRNTGTNAVTWDLPETWAPDNDFSTIYEEEYGPLLYWARGYLSSPLTFYTSPVGTQAWLHYEVETTPARKTAHYSGSEFGDPTPVLVMASTDGYAMKVGDDMPLAECPAGMEKPYVLSVDLVRNDDFTGAPSVSTGTVKLTNPDGRFDKLADYSWSDVPVQIWEGEWGDAFSTFTRVFDGSAEDYTYSYDHFELQLRGKEAKLANDIRQANRMHYGGFDQCLRGHGVSGPMASTGTDDWNTWTLGDVTVEARVRLGVATGETGYQTVISHAGSGATSGDNRCYYIVFDADNAKFGAGWEYGTGTGYTKYVDNGATDWEGDGEWHHIAMVRDTVNRIFRIYADGVMLKEDYYSSSEDPAGGFLGHIYLGSNAAGSNMWADSWDIDEVRIWNTALSRDDIRDRMDAIISPDEDNLMAYYRLDEGYGTATYDEVAILPQKEHLYNHYITDGSSAVASIPDHDDWHSSNITIEGWAYGRGPQAGSKYVYAVKSNAWRVESDSNDILEVGLYDGSSWTTTQYSLVTIGLGKVGWFHWAFSYNNTNKELKLYYNGGLNKTATLTGFTGINDSPTVVRLGYNSTNYYRGAFADLRCWSAILTGTEIAEWYDQQINSAHGKYANLEGWWDFQDDNSGGCLNKAASGSLGDMTFTNGENTTATMTLDGDMDQSNWVGTGEGSVDMKGAGKQVVLGEKQHVPLIMVDPVHAIYQATIEEFPRANPYTEGGTVLIGGMEDCTAVYEGGVALSSVETTSDIFANPPIVTGGAAIRQDPDKVWAYDDSTTTYTDQTTAAGNNTTDDVNLTGAPPDSSDYLYIGNDNQFAGVDIRAGTQMQVNGGCLLTVQYYNGSSWSAFPGLSRLTDPSYGYTRPYTHTDYDADAANIAQGGHTLAASSSGTDDVLAWRWVIPTDWAKVNINGGGEYYFVRFSFTANPTSYDGTSAITATRAWTVMNEAIYDKNRGMVRFQNFPNYVPTADIKGLRRTASQTYADRAGAIMEILAKEPFADFEDADIGTSLDSLGAADSKFVDQATTQYEPTGVIFGYNDELPIGDAMALLADSYHAPWYISTSTKLEVGQIPVPEDESSPSLELTSDDFLVFERLATPLPAWRQYVGWGQYGHQFNESDINENRLADTRSIADMQNEYRYAEATAKRTKKTYRLSTEHRINAQFTTEKHAWQEARRRRDLFSVRRNFYKISVPNDRLGSFNMTDVINIDPTQEDKNTGVYTERYQIPRRVNGVGGKNVVIVGMSRDVDKETTELVVWG